MLYESFDQITVQFHWMFTRGRPRNLLDSSNYLYISSETPINEPNFFVLRDFSICSPLFFISRTVLDSFTLSWVSHNKISFALFFSLSFLSKIIVVKSASSAFIASGGRSLDTSLVVCGTHVTSPSLPIRVGTLRCKFEAYTP